MSKKGQLAAQNWLLKSIAVCDGKGSAAYYHLYKGWSTAYPETTGYIIPTLLNIYQETRQAVFLARAITCADWLVSLQLKNGAFPGGVGGKEAPNVFDTGQIIIGLTAIYKFSKNKKYLLALKKAVIHLLEILERDGSWQKEVYIQNYIPSYYTRVVWAILQTNKYVDIPDLETKMKLALSFYTKQIRSNYTVKNWAFNVNEKALTHTIAYTIRGFLESALLLEDKKTLQTAENLLIKLLEIVKEKGKLAGSYDENWQGDYRFICIPGHFQISIICARFYQITQKEIYRKWALLLFETAKKAQNKLPFQAFNGGFGGTAPIWRPYQRFKLINWSVKFYLDATYEIKSL